MTDVRESEVGESSPREASRRVVLGGAAVIGAGAVLSACGGGSGETSPGAIGSTGSTESASSGGSDASGGSGAGESVGKAADVPVGSGIIVASAKAVITQPKEGEFKAFSSTCTHKGCQVSRITGDTITCPCHGSQYSTADGSVKKGPAPAPLAPLSVTEKDGQLFLS